MCEREDDLEDSFYVRFSCELVTITNVQIRALFIRAFTNISPFALLKSEIALKLAAQQFCDVLG